jgi:hypothetical protein
MGGSLASAGGQSRVHDYHHPENYLLPEDGEAPTAD